MPKDPAKPDGATIDTVLFLPLQPSHESEEIGPDLTCILPILAGACGIVNEVQCTLTLGEGVGQFLRLSFSELHGAFFAAMPLYCLKCLRDDQLLRNQLINSSLLQGTCEIKACDQYGRSPQVPAFSVHESFLFPPRLVMSPSPLCAL